MEDEKEPILNGNPLLTKKQTTIKELLMELVQAITDLESRIVLTVKLLFTKPEVVIFEYISGKKNKYIKPFRFLIVTLFLNYLIFSLFMPDDMELFFAVEAKEFFIDSVKEMSENGIKAKLNDEAYASTMREFSKLFLFFYKGIFCIQIPASVLAHLVLFRNLKLNIASHVIMATFLLVSCSLITVVVTSINSLVFDIMVGSYLSLVPLAVYLSYAYSRMAKGYYWHPVRRGIILALTVVTINLVLIAAFGAGVIFKVKSNQLPIIQIQKALKSQSQ